MTAFILGIIITILVIKRKKIYELIGKERREAEEIIKGKETIE